MSFSLVDNTEANSIKRIRFRIIKYGTYLNVHVNIIFEIFRFFSISLRTVYDPFSTIS